MAMDMGVLVADARWNRLQTGVPGGWWLTSLEQERRLGVRPLYLSPDGVNLDCDCALALWATEEGPQVGQIAALPRICHNLLVAPTQAGARLLRDLNGRLDTVVFNETNRFPEQMLYGMLGSVPAIAPYLPMPVPADAKELPGACLVTPRRRAAKTAEQYCLSSLPTGPDGLAGEWRLYLHRNEAGDWVVAGGVAKHDLLRKSRFRERCWPFEKALSLTFGRGTTGLSDRLHQLAIDIVQTLSLYQPGLVHCAIDFWMDEARHPWLADLTGRYRTDWLAKAGEVQALREVEEHPLRFASMLARTGVEKLHVDFGRSWGAQRA